MPSSPDEASDTHRPLPRVETREIVPAELWAWPQSFFTMSNSPVGWAKAPRTAPSGATAANAAPCPRGGGCRDPGRRRVGTAREDGRERPYGAQVRTLCPPYESILYP